MKEYRCQPDVLTSRIPPPIWRRLMTGCVLRSRDRNIPRSSAIVGWPDASSVLYAAIHSFFPSGDSVDVFRHIVVVSNQAAQAVAQEFDDFVRNYAPKGLLVAMSKDQQPFGGQCVASHVLKEFIKL